MEWRWKYFHPSEVLSDEGLRHLKRNNLKLQGFALDRLEMFRKWLGKPLHCNHGHLKRRGWRSTKENRKIGGVNDSPHVQGIAFDLSCYDMSLAEFATAVVMYSAFHPSNEGFRGIGIYPDNNFVHVDCRTLPVKTEDYLVTWSRTLTTSRASIIKYSDLFKESPARTLDLLKAELALPKKWRIK